VTEPRQTDPESESTVRLVTRIRAGDERARTILIERYFAALHRWARGRLPRYARAEMNTEDLVQETMVRALSRLDAFEARETGSFLAYLRQILKNRIRDEIRKIQRRPQAEELEESVEEPAPSPVEEAIGVETWERYEAALARLPRQQQEGVIMRIELQFSHQQVADALGMASANAARMMVSRAIARLAELMEESGEAV
jgi:RNA polymerase sigma-70 factor (ECF subfamily)